MTSATEKLFHQAYKLQQEGQFTTAIKHYERLLELDPTHANALHFLGLVYAQVDDIPQAIAHLSRAQRLCPENPAVLNNLANAYKKTGQQEQAIDCYLQAIAINPEYAQAHNNLAALYAKQQLYSKALYHYSKAVHAEPDFSAAHFNLGLLLLENNQLEAAKVQFNNVITLTPNHSEAHFYLGVLHLQHHSLTEAEQAFHQVLAQDNEHIQALINLGVLALKQEKKQLAVDYFSKALALDNENLEARNNLAATFMHHDRFENALMHYDVLLKKDPTQIEYLYNAAVAQMALGHLNEAITLFNRLLKIQPNHSHSLSNLAAIYLKLDQRVTARDYLQQAVSANPDDHVSQHMLHALTGNTLAQTNTEYAHHLFNNYALYYDQHMQNALHYSIPQHIARTIHQLQLPPNRRVLELGCGTGLTGIVLRESSDYLKGIDIAPKMLVQAEEKGIYDELEETEISAFLEKNEQRFDLIVAADVFPYLGQLDSVFQSIYQQLNPGGYFIFTSEISESSSWLLGTSARFSHHPGYIKKLAEKTLFTFISQEKIPGRIQNQHPLPIMLYTLKREQQVGG